MTRLLVSVRSAAEAEEALAGGAHIIDVKEPLRGSLGAADEKVVAAVIEHVAGRRPISVAYGDFELEEGILPDVLPGVSYAKMALSRLPQEMEWRSLLAMIRRGVERHSSARFVAVAYADWKVAFAPPAYDVLKEAIEQKYVAFLIDTWSKDGKSLLDWHSVEELTDFCRQCREANVLTVLAGSLKSEQIEELLPANPDYFGVRGSACVGNDRLATIDAKRVAELVALLSPPC